MKKLLLTKNQVALVDDEDFESLSQYSWCAIKPANTYYAQTTINGKGVALHTLIYPVAEGLIVDHKDGDGLNNQKSNLRPATHQQNCWNRPPTKFNKCGYKGVRRATKNSFSARIQTNGQTLNLGSFKTAEDAALAYNQKAVELYGEFAWLNPVGGHL